MHWLELFILTLIVISFLRGFVRGLFASLILGIKFLIVPFFITKYGQEIATFIVNEWKLGELLTLALGEIPVAHGTNYIQNSNLTDISAVEWHLIEREAIHFIDRIDLPPFTNEVLLSALNPELLFQFQATHAGNWGGIKDFITTYFSHGIAFLLAVSLIFLAALFITSLVVNLVFSFFTLFRVPKRITILSFFSRLLGAGVSGFFTIVILGILLIILEPILSFFSFNLVKTPLVTYFFSFNEYLQPWLEDLLHAFYWGG